MKHQRLHSIYFLPFSVVIGILAAIGALFFRAMIETFQNLFWAGGPTFVDKLINSPSWLKILVPVSGGLVAGAIITFFVPEARGPGVPEVILSVTSRQSTIRHRVTFLKAIVTSLLIGSGASVGREGPIAQIGASVGSSLAQLFRVHADLRRVSLAAGAAAGIAATFNAPITGTLFAVEIILLDTELAHISHIVVASVIGSVLSQIFWGKFPAFKVGPVELIHYQELNIYLALGLLAGFVAICFVRLIYTTDGLFRRLQIPEWIKPGIGGLLLGLIAFKLPHVLGVGYETVNLALANSLSLKLAIIFIFAKILATSLSIGSGMSGGIFAPSLVLGATLGTVVGLGAQQVFPELASSPSNYVLAGMGAVVAGTTLAPITAIITVFELTYNYHIILPLMVACISSAIIVRLFFGYSAYEMKLLMQGINILRGHDVGILRELLTKDFMVKEFDTLRDTAPLSVIVERAAQSSYPHFVVLNEREELVGIVSLIDIKPYLANLEKSKEHVIASDLMTKEVITLSAEDNLENALYLFEKERISFLPIIDPENPKKVLGILKKDDLLHAYKEKVLKDRLLSSPLSRF
ncbi:MAG: chloride channel protein [Deltaproteobacteria bacterium]|nr:MAG: chloride channel protein [Deltaproteobacteria bacterium]